MRHALIPIPFWTDTIEVDEIVAASRVTDFNITSLSVLGTKRLAYASLYERDDNHHLVPQMADNEFIEFIPGSKS
ncbi:MAG: hypothetical protein J5I81_11010 [Nitrococcus mobilis]|nr:hypothetical protein [Nitrococcus mobilis]